MAIFLESETKIKKNNGNLGSRTRSPNRFFVHIEAYKKVEKFSYRKDFQLSETYQRLIYQNRYHI